MIGEATNKVHSLTEETGSGLQKFNASILATSQTFGQDFVQHYQR